VRRIDSVALVLAVALLGGALLFGVPGSFASVANVPTLRVDGSTVEATGPNGAQASYDVKADDSSTNPATPLAATCDTPSGASGTGDFTVTAQFALGTTSVTCTTTDLAGTVLTASADVVVQDTTPPSIAATSNLTASTTDPSGTTVHYDKPTATDIVDGTDPVSCSPASDTNFAVGTTTVTCTSTDAHGNTATATFTVTVTLSDTTPPVVTVPGDITVNSGSSAGTTVTYSASANDNVDGPLTPSCNPSSGSTFPIGSTTVTCTATDSHGNTGSASFTVTVVLVDTTPPTFQNVPADMKVEATGPSGSVVTYTTPTATDDSDGPIALVTCAPASGSTFPLGTTTVTCSATDSHGNTGTVLFTVQVVDTTPPHLIVPGDASVYASSGSGAAASDAPVAAWLASAKASDLVDPHPFLTNNAPGTFPTGVTTVTFVARDASGNAASGTAALDVLPQPPAGTTPAPLPPPVDRQPPDDVGSLSATAGDRVVKLTWTAPKAADFAYVVITRSTGVSAGNVVYRGAATSFTDRGVSDGIQYRYLVVAFDKNGNGSRGVAVVASPKRAALRSPADGAQLRKPPVLRWIAVSGASYYNVQIFRGAASTKILSAWPTKPKLVLHRRWTFAHTRFSLVPGVYHWYVWPGFGARADIDYGSLLGSSTFVIRRS
jgi:hypothetical protein